MEKEEVSSSAGTNGGQDKIYILNVHNNKSFCLSFSKYSNLKVGKVKEAIYKHSGRHIADQQLLWENAEIPDDILLKQAGVKPGDRIRLRFKSELKDARLRSEKKTQILRPKTTNSLPANAVAVKSERGKEKTSKSGNSEEQLVTRFGRKVKRPERILAPVEQQEHTSTRRKQKQMEKSPSKSTMRRKRGNWTAYRKPTWTRTEVEYLLKGVKEEGRAWQKILARYPKVFHKIRTRKDLARFYDTHFKWAGNRSVVIVPVSYKDEQDEEEMEESSEDERPAKRRRVETNPRVKRERKTDVESSDSEDESEEEEKDISNVVKTAKRKRSITEEEPNDLTVERLVHKMARRRSLPERKEINIIESLHSLDVHNVSSLIEMWDVVSNAESLSEAVVRYLARELAEYLKDKVSYEMEAQSFLFYTFAKHRLDMDKYGAIAELFDKNGCETLKDVKEHYHRLARSNKQISGMIVKSIEHTLSEADS